MSRAWYGLLPVFAGLIVVLMGWLLLSAADLVGFSADSAGPIASQSAASDSAVLRPAAAAPALSEADQKIAALGGSLFEGNCQQCHAVNDVVVGPALRDVTERRPASWLIPWIKNSSKVVASGDEYAVALFNKYQKQQMPSFALADKEIEAILFYIETHEPPVVVSAVAAR